MELPTSIHCTQKQTKEVQREFEGAIYVLRIRWDDYQLNNGYNSFGVTVYVYDCTHANGEPSRLTNSGKRLYLGSCGCQHELVSKVFPEFSHLPFYHLMGATGPMHYIANTMYHMKQGNLTFARQTAMWPEATPEQLMSSIALMARLPELMERFKAVITSLGFVY